MKSAILRSIVAFGRCLWFAVAYSTISISAIQSRRFAVINNIMRKKVLGSKQSRTMLNPKIY